jgi:hypothetical protein
MNSNVEGLIAQIKSDLSKYDDAGLIDDTSLYRDITLGLKRFGNDVMILQETMVEVKNGYGELPQSFFSLYSAYLCNPAGFTSTQFIHQDPLISSIVYKEKVINEKVWSECDASCETITENVIRENVYFNGKAIQLRYSNPTLLTLGKSFNKSNCHSACRNKLVRDNPNEIVILDYRLQANFNEGYIYMQFYGLPTDEEGNIEIPETKNGHLETFLEYFLKRRLAERLMGNNDAQGLQNLYTIYKQEETVALKNASTELKMSKLKPSTFAKIKRLNQLESKQFETNF